MKVTIVIGVILGLAAVGLAVVGTGHGPSASDVPVVITSRPVTAAFAASVNAPSPVASSLATQSAVASTHSKPASVSGKNPRSAKRTGTPVSNSVEIVKPPLHDDGDNASTDHKGRSGDSNKGE